MQPDKPTGNLNERQDAQAVLAESAEVMELTEAISVVCDELFTSHALGIANVAD